MRKMLLAVSIVCSAALFAGEGDVSSLCDEVLAKMRNSRRDVHGDSSWARWLFVNLGSDSNRVCQVAEAVYARAADKMDQEDALLLINRYTSATTSMRTGRRTIVEASVRYKIDTHGLGDMLFDDWGEFYIDREEYADKIVRRAANPDVFVAIEIKLAK